MKLELFHPSDDFFTDRLCRRYGVAVYIFVALLIAMAYLSPGAFSCWNPTHFNDNHVEHSAQVCWNEGSFYEYVDYRIPSDSIDTKLMFNLRNARYMPLLLIVQSLLFLLPRVLWNAITTLTNFQTGRLVRSMHTEINRRPQGTALDQQDPVHDISAKVLSHIQLPFPVFGSALSIIGGYVLSVGYLLCKLCYCLVSIIQVTIVGRYLGINFFAFGFGRPLWKEYVTFQGIQVNGTTEWKAEPLFPRTVMCEFKVRRLGNVQRYTHQCEISANEMVEVAFFILWFWMMLSMAILIISTILWFIRILLYVVAPLSYKTHRVLLYLGQSTSKSPASNHQSGEVGNFAGQFLKPDGSLLLEILEENVSMVAASEIVKAAWRIHQGQCPWMTKHEDLGEGNGRQMELSPMNHGMTRPLSSDASHLETIPLVEY